MRFPGTGDGVARLVEVSMVKVDMARLSNDRAITPPAIPFRLRKPWNIAGDACVKTTGALAPCRRGSKKWSVRWSIAIGLAT
jgi:hypothetical protein